MDANTINNILLFSITLTGAGLTALWLGMTLWTWQDMRARSRDPIAQIMATIIVFVLPLFGLIVYLMLRPRETLADAYERSLEEEALLQEIEEKPHCPGCGRAVQNNWQVCPYCHTRLKKSCINCEQLLELTWNLCPHCATPQTYPDQQQAKRSSSVLSQLNNSPYEDDLEFIDD